MNRSTALTAAGAASIVCAVGSLAWALDAIHGGQVGAWKVACLVMGGTGTYGIWQLGRASEAFRHERRTR